MTNINSMESREVLKLLVHAFHALTIGAAVSFLLYFLDVLRDLYLRGSDIELLAVHIIVSGMIRFLVFSVVALIFFCFRVSSLRAWMTVILAIALPVKPLLGYNLIVVQRKHWLAVDATNQIELIIPVIVLSFYQVVLASVGAFIAWRLGKMLKGRTN